MEKARNASEFALDLFLPDQFLDLIDHRGARIPRRLRVIFSEVFRHFVQAQISNMREMRGGMAGIDHCELIPLRERDRQAGLLQQISSR